MEKNLNALKTVKEVMIEGIKRGDLTLNNIPQIFLDQDIFNVYFDITMDLSSIRKEFITKEMVDKYLSNRKEPMFEIKYIPEEFLTKEIVDDYLSNYGVIKNVPRKFINQELVNKYIFEGSYRSLGRIVDIVNTFKSIPKEFLTKEILDKHWEYTTTLVNFPDEYITDEKISQCWNTYKNINYIPEKYITQEMVDEYVKNTEYFNISEIPERFITKNILLRKIYDRNILKYISEENKCYEIYNKYINNIKKEDLDIEGFVYYLLEYIPEEYLTTDLVDEIFIRTKNLEYIPERFLNINMIKSAVRYNIKNIEYVPDYYITIDLIKSSF